MRLLLSGGGTGGHVYPALAVLAELNRCTDVDLSPLDAVLYVGTERGLESRIAVREGLAFEAVDAGAMRSLGLWRATLGAARIVNGTRQAGRILAEFRPDVVLATGGYASVPVAMAARLRGCPVLVYLPDVEPGLAVRALALIANRVAVSFDATLRYFPSGKAVVTGYPVRHALFERGRAKARARLSLDPDLKTVLVFGGSRGARSLNVALQQILPQLLPIAQVVHIGGEQGWEELRGAGETLAEELRGRYHLYPYLHEEMPDALVAADLAIARAGAATLGEFAAVGLPSILVPYPFSGQHQEVNADFLVARGAAVKVLDRELERKLWITVHELLSDEAALASMASQARQLARPDAARSIATQLALLARGNPNHE